MSDIKIQPSATGSGTVTITAPTTNTARVITLPDSAGTLLDENSSVPAANLTGTVADARFPATLPAISGANLTGIASVPSGVIAMWHGAAGAIPSGWVICDGTNSTPNLTDKFIKSTGTAGGTGGSATTGAHTLTTAEMPSHQHGYEGGIANAQANASWGIGYYGSQHVTSNTGGGGSHTHPQSEPIFFALIFIMKT